MLKLYHGSNIKIEKIDLSKGRINKDFGKGFYLTTVKSQAEEMAKRKAKQYLGTNPVVTEFYFDNSVLLSNKLKIKQFTEVSAEWAEFILKNRKASRTGFHHDYDIVIGPIADDGVVQQLDLYEMNLISMNQLVEALRWRDLNDQYFFGTEKAISKLQVL
ncbi:MAG: DUF3990 domain-containing protein [Bacteroidia bacterium]|nr:DUF3990 domain-containing protein [Bacteroidia bacterium]